MITITADLRWTRTSFRDGGNWEQVPCFRFTSPDGRVSWAQGLFPEQQVEFARQEAERARDAEIDRLLVGLGF